MAEVVATDYHPDVLQNLSSNVDANPGSVSAEVGITVASLNWQLIHEMPDAKLEEPLKRPFDVIIAADVVYRPSHALWLASTVRRFLRRPKSTSSISEPASFHLIAPTRPTHEQTHSSIEAVFSEVSVGGGAEEPYGATAMPLIVDKYDYPRTKSVGRADEQSYREYRIEWQ
jgi:hypothetical protein